jgi:hypothetical protein
MEQRANAYQAMVWHILQTEGILLPDERTVRVIVLRHTDAVWRDDLGDVPVVCLREEPELKSPQAVNERLAQIPTRFAIESDCDRQLLVAAASKVVAMQAPKILEFLEGRQRQGEIR